MGEDERALGVMERPRNDLAVAEEEDGATQVAESEHLLGEAVSDLGFDALNQLYGLLEHSSKRVADDHADVVR